MPTPRAYLTRARYGKCRCHRSSSALLVVVEGVSLGWMVFHPGTLMLAVNRSTPYGQE